MGFHIFPTKGSWGQTPLVALGRQDQGLRSPLWSFFNEDDNDNDNENEDEDDNEDETDE